MTRTCFFSLSKYLVKSNTHFPLLFYFILCCPVLEIKYTMGLLSHTWWLAFHFGRVVHWQIPSAPHCRPLILLSHFISLKGWGGTCRRWKRAPLPFDFRDISCLSANRLLGKARPLVWIVCRKALSLSFPQGPLYSFQGTAQSGNAGPLVQKLLTISRWQIMKPRGKPFWEWGFLWLQMCSPVERALPQCKLYVSWDCFEWHGTLVGSMGVVSYGCGQWRGLTLWDSHCFWE